MAKTVSGLVIGLAACLLLGPGRADPPKPAEPPREGDARKEVKKRNELMQRKLANSQKILEGIAVNKFDLIEKGADELIEVVKETEWKVLKTPLYDYYSTDFGRIAESLKANAQKRNLDAAALNYVDMTLLCVKCHKHVRETRVTRAPWDADPVAVVRGTGAAE
jgi:hypothetical protein